MFDTEIKGLQNLIQAAEKYCIRHGYDAVKTNEFIDGKCQNYVDIFIPIVAVTPEIYSLLIKERPTLSPYLLENINRYLMNMPSQGEVEKDFIDALGRMNIFSNMKGGEVDLNHFTCIQIMVNKYGFSQELLRAVNKVKPEIFKLVLHLYDMRLNAAQSVGNDVDNPWDR